MAKLTDRQLMDQAREGDSDAFGTLVRRHQRRIFRLAFHLLRNGAEAEDVTQETFVRAYQALARFDGRSEPDPRIEAFLIERRPSHGSNPASATEQREMAKALCEGIDALSDTLRTTLIVVCIDGTGHEEASKILGCPEGTVAWRVHEARRKLKEYLKGRGFYQGEES